jgi:hypothetical protein
MNKFIPRKWPKPGNQRGCRTVLTAKYGARSDVTGPPHVALSCMSPRDRHPADEVLVSHSGTVPGLLTARVKLRVLTRMQQKWRHALPRASSGRRLIIGDTNLGCLVKFLCWLGKLWLWCLSTDDSALPLLPLSVLTELRKEDALFLHPSVYLMA